jgi:hypothetical protein
MWLISPSGGNPWLFRGGFALCAVATLMMVAAVTHERAYTSRVLSVPVLLWIGTRSYGLYLYHWPIYQLIRGITGKHLTFAQFVFAMIVTLIVTELSYRFIETPIRKGTVVASWRRIRNSPVPGPRNALVATGVVVGAFSLFAVVSLATAPVIENEVKVSLDQGAAATCDVVNDANCDGIADNAPIDSSTVTNPAGTATSGSIAVVAPPTVETTTTTTSPPEPIAKLALGDSVMLGAAPQLQDQGFVVDAVEGRAFINGLDVVQKLQQQGRLGGVAVVHLGTNGPISPTDMTAMMEALAGVPQVLLLTTDVDRDYTAANNSLIYDTAAQYPNVTLLDWAGLDGSCPGNCFYKDGYHLRPDGQVYYAQLIAERLQTPG